MNLLEKASTLELVNELASRTNIEKISVEPERPYEFRKPYDHQKSVLTKGIVLVVPEESYLEA